MIVTNKSTLRLKSEEFKGSKKELKTLIETLELELEQSKKQGLEGVGLSAIQIGIPDKVAIIRYKTKIKQYGEKIIIEIKHDLWNTEIVEKYNKFTFKGEGCLSLPNEYYNTERYNEITIKNGDGEIKRFTGFDAIIIQHEIDHWNGILVCDKQRTEK